MKMLSLVFAVILAAPTVSFATAQNPEIARCKALREVRLKQAAWAASYEKFKKDESVSFEDRFIVSYKGAEKIVRLIEEMRAVADIKGTDPLLRDAHRLFDAIENNEITKRSAVGVLTSGLENLREKMDDVTYRAETKTECKISERVIGINPKAKPVDIDILRAGVR